MTAPRIGRYSGVRGRAEIVGVLTFVLALEVWKGGL